MQWHSRVTTPHPGTHTDHEKCPGTRDCEIPNAVALEDPGGARAPMAIYISWDIEGNLSPYVKSSPYVVAILHATRFFFW